MSEAVYRVITQRFVDALREGKVPWRRPWSVFTAKSLGTGQPYAGINSLILNTSGYESEWWCTFKEAQRRGGSVKKGEHGTPILRVIGRPDTLDGDGNVTKKGYTSIRYYLVFNESQIEGVSFPARSAVEFVSHERAETIAAHAGLPIQHGGNRAFYVPAQDYIGVPDKSQFEAWEDYYRVLFHELVHSTGHSSRLARKAIVDMQTTILNTFGQFSYGEEELVAEIGSAMLGARVNLQSDVVENQLAYACGWADRISADASIVVRAASAAQKAADWLLEIEQELAEIEGE